MAYIVGCTRCGLMLDEEDFNEDGLCPRCEDKEVWENKEEDKPRTEQ